MPLTIPPFGLEIFRIFAYIELMFYGKGTVFRRDTALATLVVGRASMVKKSEGDEAHEPL
jgi:hypothetical protein